MSGPPTGTPGDRVWRDDQARRLLDFGRRSALPGGGFGWPDDDGEPDPTAPRPLYLTARATYVFALAALAGVAWAGDVAAGGIAALRNQYTDPDHDGWFAGLDAHGVPDDTTKANYAHAHIVLASASGTAAGIDGAAELFAEARDVVVRHFWSDDEGLAVESWDRGFTELEPYRGANSNMHSVEAYLAAGDVTGDPAWHRRALSIASALIDTDARANGWRVPEHFDASWHQLPDYNADQPNHQFRPPGTTPGHSFEWARLLLTLHHSLDAPPPWLLEAAAGLFGRAVTDSDGADGNPGLLYTVDRAGAPLVTARLHWVICEAVLAADALARTTGEQHYVDSAAAWWRQIDEHFIDHERGGWWPELAPDLTPATTTWSGKPDLYHAYQALLLPSLPLAPTAATALVRAADR